MKRLVGKGFDSIGAARAASIKWLEDHYPASSFCDMKERTYRFSKYLEVEGKSYRVYFFENNKEDYDAYFFSTAEEAQVEIEKRRKKSWKNRTKGEPINPEYLRGY